MSFDNVNINVSGGQSIIKALQNYNTIILKPNIIDNRNVLTQEMISEKHTKYIIKWNYSLEDETIIVPKDCIIEFAGGTIDNGTIVGNNTIFIYSKPIDEVCLAKRQGTFIYNTTVADEEDITSESGQLKFKDRPSTNGMGRKILRKNIVDGINILTQGMINQSNTIYVIRYNFTLGEDITIPENCILEFDGGSLSGEVTITSQDTRVIGYDISCINNVIILGGFIENEINKGTNNITYTLADFGDYKNKAIQVFVNACSKTDCKLFINDDISFNSSSVINITSAERIHIYSNGKKITSNISIIFETVNDVEIYGLIFKFSSGLLQIGKSAGISAETRNGSRLYIHHNEIYGNKNTSSSLGANGGGIHVISVHETRIDSNYIQYTQGDGILVHMQCHDIVVTNNIVLNAGVIGIEFEGRFEGMGTQGVTITYLSEITNVTCINNTILNSNMKGMMIFGVTNFIVSNNIVKGGIHCIASMNGIISNNNIDGNSNTGVRSALLIENEYYDYLRSNERINICGNRLKGGFVSNLSSQNKFAVGVVVIKRGYRIVFDGNYIEQTVNNSTIKRKAIVMINNSRYINITNNIIYGTKNGDGIILCKGYKTEIDPASKYPYYGFIEDNVGCFNIEIINNILQECVYGIGTIHEYDSDWISGVNDSPNYITIYGNSIKGCTYDISEGHLAVVGNIRHLTTVDTTNISFKDNLYTHKSTNRPTLQTKDKGYMMFDTSSNINKPIWWNGTNWVDATGATV